MTPNSLKVRSAKAVLLDEFDLNTDGFIDLALECEDEIKKNAANFGVSLDEEIDCQRLLEEAQHIFAESSLEAALELDSLTSVFRDCSAGHQ